MVSDCNVAEKTFASRIPHPRLTAVRMSRSMNRPCVWLMALWAVALGAQDLFRSEVNLINVGFTVRDAQGRLVRDLTREDIEITEDGVPQKVAFFGTSADVPLTIALLVDVSGSQEKFVKSHRRDVERFLKSTLGPKDRVFAVCYGNTLRLLQDYTSLSKDVAQRLEDFHDGERDFRTLGPPERRILGTAFYDANYYAIAERLADSGIGRKAILNFGDGEDNSSAHHMVEVLEMAQNADVTIHNIRYTPSDEDDLNARNKYGIGVMDRLSRDTGGLHLDARKGNMSQHFATIAEELRSAYELGYYSSNPEKDGAFRKISIKLKRPGLRVRTKTGYYAR